MRRARRIAQIPSGAVSPLALGEHPREHEDFLGARVPVSCDASGAPMVRSAGGAHHAVGLDRVRVHDLRPTFACRLRAAGVAAEDRSALLGHAEHSISGHYASADVGRLVGLANLVLNREETRTVLRVANGWPVTSRLWITGPAAVPQ